MPLTPHGALPLIMQAALTERDTLINATSLPPGVARGYVQQLGLQPAPLVQPAQWTRRMYRLLQLALNAQFNQLVYIKCTFVSGTA